MTLTACASQQGSFQASPDKQRVAQAFSQASYAYSQQALVQQSIADHLIDRLSNGFDLNQVKHAIDIGCGTGYVTHQLAKPGQRWTGIDIAEGMLQHAARTSPATLNTEWILGDAEDLPCADQSVDLAVSSMALQWVNDHHAAMRQLKRVLKHNAEAFLAILRHDALPELHQGWQILEQGYRVNQFADRITWQQAIQSANLRLLSVESEQFTTFHTDVFALLHSINRIGAGITTSDTGSRAPLKRADLKRLADWWGVAHPNKRGLPLTYSVDFYHLQKID